MNAHFIHSSGSHLYAQVDLGLYSLTALLKVAHRFTDRCFLHLQWEADNVVGVRLRSKVEGRDESELVGRFLNELLDQTLRERIQAQTEGVRNLLLAHALSDTDLLSSSETNDDPLAEVQVP